MKVEKLRRANLLGKKVPNRKNGVCDRRLAIRYGADIRKADGRAVNMFCDTGILLAQR